MTPELRTAITTALVNNGWAAGAWTAVAHKMYDTAVGDREAFAYVQDWGADEPCLLLVGDYQSEGNNALSTCTARIPRNAAPDEIEALVTTWAVKADEMVAQTYAAGLLIRHGFRAR